METPNKNKNHHRHKAATGTNYATIAICAAALTAMLIFATVERPIAANALKGETPVDRLHDRLYSLLRNYEADRDLLSYKWNHALSFDSNVKGLLDWWCDNNNGSVVTKKCHMPTKDFAGFAMWYNQKATRAFLIHALDTTHKYPGDKAGIKKLLVDEYNKLS
jgi:hypothetical protein